MYQSITHAHKQTHSVSHDTHAYLEVRRRLLLITLRLLLLLVVVTVLLLKGV